MTATNPSASMLIKNAHVFDAKSETGGNLESTDIATRADEGRNEYAC